MNTKKIIGNYCRKFRISLDLTLNDISEISEIKVKTISAFENGRSSNMNILFHVYWNLCKGDPVIQHEFVNGLFKEL